MNSSIIETLIHLDKFNLLVLKVCQIKKLTSVYSFFLILHRLFNKYIQFLVVKLTNQLEFIFIDEKQDNISISYFNLKNFYYTYK